MNKKIIISIILILTLIILAILFTPKWKGKSANMNEIKENIKNKDTPFDFSNKYVTLNNGIKMPIIGLGTWTFTNEEAEGAVYIATKNGYRLIDIAQYYGDKVGVGKGIRKAIDEGIVKREDIFVTSKIYASTDHNKAIEKSLSNLDLDYKIYF